MSGPAPAGPPLADLPSDTLSPNIIGSAVACWIIAAVFVAIRFYTRTRIIRALNSSDWSILAALIFSLGCAEGQIEEAIHGSGRHIWFIDLQDFNNGIYWARAGWYNLLFYTLTLCMTKISILLLYLHIFSFQWIRRVGQLVFAIVIISNIYMVVAVFTACIPLQAYWDIRITEKYCHPQSVWWANTALLMITDFLIFLLPLPVVWTLNAPRRQKYALLGIFGLGFFICLISIIRLKYVVDLVNNPPPDYFYSMAPLSCWTMVETNGAIVCACLMTLKPFVVSVFPRIFSTSGSSPANTKQGSDRWAFPPTIGSKDPKSPRHMRETSLDELHHHHGGQAATFDAALEMEANTMRDGTSVASSLTGTPDDPSSLEPTTTGGSLNSPLATRLKAPSRRQAAPLY